MTPLSKLEAVQDQPAHQTSDSEKSIKTIILAGVVGNVIEWYDFALYGYLAPIISLLFFPNDNQIVSLLQTYGVFAAGFVMRPLGAGIFGYIGDRVSRRTELFISVILMAIPTFILGLLPTYNQIGIAAPIFLILLRLVQGLSVGGEFTGSVTYVAETAPQTRRGFTTSFVNVGSTTGLLLGLGIVALITHLLSDSNLLTWGWRLPFLFGGILGLTGLYIRSNLPDSEVFEEHQEGRQVPLLSDLKQSLVPMLQAMFFAGGYSSTYYIIMVYIPTYLDQFTDVSRSGVLVIHVVALTIQILILPLFGWLSDTTLRRKSWLLLAILSVALFGFPAFWLLLQPNNYEVWLAQIGLAIFLVPLLAISPVMMVEIFPTETRLTAYSLSFNLGASIMGGTSLLVCTWLINVSGNIYAPVIYLVISACMSAIALGFMGDRSREPLL
ncbi:MFS transporter [Roseofilum reptotaenium CS-1145]|uniref:MFS transporter n=1 Tax=Roseofilum TaxID=1233426 RepID=UPI000A6ABC68|nr:MULTISPECIES: MFS transporter [Roseofilum]MBP0027519.1 MFS transporter [Roseofilum sp. Guam]MDB9519699.1 MFS transporter [Roseofilum reptotaenium CS-1145]